MRNKDLNKFDIIFKASLELIVKDGIAGLSMAKIAKKAGIATGTLYIYFKNKEQLVNELYKKLRKDTVERFLKGYDKNKTLKIGLKTIWINYIKHRIEHYAESVFFEQYYRSPYITDQHKRIAESMKIPVHDLIQRGKDELQIKQDVDNEMLFLSMLGFIRELADEHVTGVYQLTENRIEKAFQLSWDTIKI
ncbi:MAG: TetR/AcrR family transcriptional regulator [Bacteroidales bacterium]|jgi:AcrR family transcriptional regulator|nr:TetR/AcrR family transcriptional regulator [Bacteroidales bacterium]